MTLDMGKAVARIFCKFEGCVHDGHPYRFMADDNRLRETFLCGEHQEQVDEARDSSDRQVQVDNPSGRIRIRIAAHRPIHDHELEAARVRGLLDVAVNNELKRHTLEPGGDAAGYVAFFCVPCGKAFNPDALITHLKKAADAALAKPAISKE